VYLGVAAEMAHVVPQCGPAQQSTAVSSVPSQHRPCSSATFQRPVVGYFASPGRRLNIPSPTRRACKATRSRSSPSAWAPHIRRPANAIPPARETCRSPNAARSSAVCGGWQSGGRQHRQSRSDRQSETRGLNGWLGRRQGPQNASN
jgi:hypothetical protein